MDDAIRALVERGAGIREISERLRLRPWEVRTRLRHLGLETARQRVQREAREARADGRAELVRTCPRHGRTTFRIDARGTFRCVRCNSDRVSARRRAIKHALLSEMGGACAICGYSRCERALEFHHVDPATKEFAIAFQGVTRSLSRARAEAAKCVLLCSNCHAEIEAGVAQLP
jgi:hypothetical protein